MTAQVLRGTTRPATARSGVDRCLALLGEELTAYIAGAVTVGEFHRWRADRRRRREIEERLQGAVEVADTFARANRLGAAAGWLREVGAAGVAGRSPARLLREATGEAVKRVLDAAERFTRR
ncbi:hypothetical protein Drose_11770 [Dactylosporangium roseum]|uniref:Antitoxin Xre/MbcA/ParS-like toxin-binding domain-containing protein n=1 Tax=Dactylosporangium roseum TaxID=47989 RepID=A0ABY5ZEV2_9ACTN|nr:hypothetical protein [Dactylosporangium roseum]UWZ38834.1 hypothetical protein Drose_11770 [Dactylosporangium roseum]